MEAFTKQQYKHKFNIKHISHPREDRAHNTRTDHAGAVPVRRKWRVTFHAMDS